VASRIEQILRLARQTLGDKNKDRWSDQDLLDLLDLGHKDYAHHARILRGTHDIPLIAGQAVYTVPDDVYVILRAEYEDEKLTLATYDEMDQVAHRQNTSNKRISRLMHDFNSASVNWQRDESDEPLAIIYDKSNMNELRVYPIPAGVENDINYTFENESGIVLPFAGAEMFGIVTGLDDYSFDTVYGTVVDMYDPQLIENFDTVLGEIVDIGVSTNNLQIRYIKTPDTLDDVGDTLLTPRAFDVGLKYFVVGHALRNDLDQQNSARGLQELALYDRELEQAIKVSTTNATSSTDTVTHYRSAFE
jgi:hypothetical protein